MKTNYTFFEDPGHGWLKVSHQEVKELNIADKITSFSFMRSNYAFLEEDLDANTFYDAKKKQDKNIKLKIKRYFTNKHSKIRNYENYKY